MSRQGNGAGRRSRYVLVLREHDEAGSGYSLELAPLAASDAGLRAGGRGSATNEAATGTGTTTPSEGSRVEAAGGAPSTLRSIRDTATGGAGTARRTRGERPAREEAVTPASRPPRPLGSHARGLHTPAAGAPRGGGDGESGGGGDNGGCDDQAADAGEKILQEMRALLFSQPQPQPKPQDSSSLSPSPSPRIRREVLIPVFLSPKKKGKNSKDDVWNKRQIMYGIALVGLLGFVPAIVAFLSQWALFVFAAVWGIGSIGFPFGLYGTSKMETGYSRHMGQFVFMGFCLVVIFMLYQYMALIGSSLQPEAIAPPPSAGTHGSASVDRKWTAAFAFVGVIVMAGHVFSWARGCYTGSDDDEESESSGTEDMRASDLLQRLLERD